MPPRLRQWQLKSSPTLPLKLRSLKRVAFAGSSKAENAFCNDDCRAKTVLFFWLFFLSGFRFCFAFSSSLFCHECSPCEPDQFQKCHGHVLQRLDICGQSVSTVFIHIDTISYVFFLCQVNPIFKHDLQQCCIIVFMPITKTQAAKCLSSFPF